MHGGSILWADREPAPTFPMMSNCVRTLYKWLLPPNTSGVFDRELLEKVVTMFRRKSCKAVNKYGLYAKPRKEDLKTARIQHGSGPVEKHGVVLALRLLQFLVLPEDSARILVEKTFNETTFYSSAKNPSLGSNPSSLSRYGVHPPRLKGSSVNCPFHFSITSFNA